MNWWRSPNRQTCWHWLEKRLRQQSAWVRIFAFLLLLGIVWIPFAGPIYWVGYRFERSETAEILALLLLYGGFLYALPLWGRRIHHWRHCLQRCGLIWQKQTAKDLVKALFIGAFGVFALFGLEALFGWARPVAPSPRLAQFVLEGLLMALAVAFAEELLFRGWVLAELETDYRPTSALIMDGLFFAIAHFIKPWSEIVRTFPQFMGLALLGMALVWARRTATPLPFRKYPSGDSPPPQQMTRLGYPIGLHAGLIWGYYIVKVGNLSQYTHQVPQWVTGIDDNPLAGLLGLLLLGAIAWPFSQVASASSQLATPPAARTPYDR